MKTLLGLAVAAVAVVLAGCASPSPASTTGGSTAAKHTAAPAASTSLPAVAPTEPDTAAAAKQVARAYFKLYTAGYYASVYPMIDPGARRQILVNVWIGVHVACRNSRTMGKSYKVTHAILVDHAAVMTVGFAGPLASLGSKQVTFTYARGRWYYQPSDLAVYAHHNLVQAVAAAKAAGDC